MLTPAVLGQWPRWRGGHSHCEVWRRLTISTATAGHRVQRIHDKIGVSAGG